MNIKRVKAQTIKTDYQQESPNLTERINRQINERATANSSAGYGSTPSSMQIKNVRSIDL